MILKIETTDNKPSTNREDPCGSKPPKMITRSDNMEMLSPNFPGRYPANVDCRWHIHAGPGYAIQLSFIEFELGKG